MTILGTPKTTTATVEGVAEQPGLPVTLLGEPKLLVTKATNGNVQISLPEHLPGNYAFVLKLANYAQ